MVVASPSGATSSALLRLVCSTAAVRAAEPDVGLMPVSRMTSMKVATERPTRQVGLKPNREGGESLTERTTPELLTWKYTKQDKQAGAGGHHK